MSKVFEALPEKIPITVIMLTLNEEYHLPGAIDNVKDWAEEIFIVDSLSTDRTVDIALEKGVKIVQRPFTNFGDQWNFALEKLPIKTPWTFKLDPDERLTPELKNEIRTLIEGTPKHAGYEMDRRLWFMGKPLHVFSDVLRLWQTGRCRFSDVLVNEHPLINGAVGRLKGIIEHLDSPNLYHWFDKQNRYTTMEAIMRVQGHEMTVRPNFFGTPIERRMLLKSVFHNIPFRFQLLTLYYLVFKGLWRDGKVGFAWAHLRSEVMRTRELKAQEMKWSCNVTEIPKAPHGNFDPRIISTNIQRQFLYGPSGAR